MPVPAPSSPLEALERALYSTLNGDATLDALIGAVAPSYVPGTIDRPIVTFGLVALPERNNHLGGRACEVFRHRLSAFTEQSAQGSVDKAVAQKIIARCIALLDRQKLTLTSYTCIMSIVENPFAETITVYGGQAFAGVSLDLVSWIV